LSSDLHPLTITTITTTLSITNWVTCSPCWVGEQQLQQFRRQLLIILQLLQWQVDLKISAACLLVSFSEEKFCEKKNQKQWFHFFADSL
jgi:predicted Co/Zn/Cd cation transporter (cation efflux family)